MTADEETGTIIFKGDTLRLGGTYSASFIDFDPTNIWIDTAINTSGSVTFTATNDIYVNANITTDLGNLRFEADSDSDDNGSFIQGDYEIKTTTFGDITVTGASVTVDKITSVGAIYINHMDISGVSGDITINDTLSATDMDIYANGGITINASMTATGRLFIYADEDQDGTGDLAFSNTPVLTAGASSIHYFIVANAVILDTGSITCGGNSATLAGGNSLYVISTGSSGSISVTSAVTVSNIAGLYSNDAGISIQADVEATGGNLYIVADNDDDGTGDLSFSGTPELTAGADDKHYFKAANAITLGTGSITCGGNSATLTGGDELWVFSTGASGSITVTGAITESSNIQLYSDDGGIDIQADITSTGGNLYIYADDDGDGTGNLTFDDGLEFTAGADDDHQFKAATAITLGTGSITCGANTATLTGGDTLYVAAKGALGSITVTGAISVSNAITLYSTDAGISIQADVTAAGGDLRIWPDSNTDGTGDLSFSGTPELTAGASSDHFFMLANAVTLDTGSITCGGNSATLTGGDTLEVWSTGGSGSITVASAVTESSHIYLRSYDAGISIQADVESTGGNLYLHADSDVDGTGDLSFSGTPELTAGADDDHRFKAANAITLGGGSITCGGNSATLTGGDTLYVYSIDGGIEVDGNVTATGGDIYLYADFDEDGVGDFTHTSGTISTSTSGKDIYINGNTVSLGTITTNAGSITVTAIGDITSNSADFTADTVTLTSTAGNVGTSSTPFAVSATSYVEAIAESGSAEISKASVTLTIISTTFSDGVYEVVIDSGSATYGGESLSIGDGLRYATPPSTGYTDTEKSAFYMWNIYLLRLMYQDSLRRLYSYIRATALIDLSNLKLKNLYDFSIRPYIRRY
jgi:hypothetical protein